jgi:hypothetical protein
MYNGISWVIINTVNVIIMNQFMKSLNFTYNLKNDRQRQKDYLRWDCVAVFTFEIPRQRRYLLLKEILFSERIAKSPSTIFLKKYQFEVF